MTCNKDLQTEGKTYPRTCSDCGLGPCNKYPPNTYATVWVLMPDYGLEGLREPFMAFRTKDAAEACKELIEKNPSATTMKLAEVPVWRH